MRGNHHTQTPTRAKSSAVQLLTMLTIVLLGLMACRPQPNATAALNATLPSTSPDTEAPSAPSASRSTPASSSTPIPPVGPDDYPENVNPLTGLIVDDPAVLDRRPLAIKVSNHPPEVRPQAGLSFADLVFEHYTEGNLTRLTAIYYGQSAQRVGSVRSGRLIDLELPVMYDAIFVSSGFSNGVAELMRSAPWVRRNLSGSFGYGEPYLCRSFEDDIAFEHTLFANPDAIWIYADEHDLNQRPNLAPGMAFDQTIPEGGTPATQATIAYMRTTVYWEYDGATGLYGRWQDNQPHTDALTGDQLTAANVIVLEASHNATEIVEDVSGALSIEIQIWGEGALTLCRDGQCFQGLWHREDRADGFTFTNLEGDVLPLRPGNTWFQVVPLDFDDLTVEP